jgi:hypothetical protein
MPQIKARSEGEKYTFLRILGVCYKKGVSTIKAIHVCLSYLYCISCRGAG